jgi:hypothetical protein
MRLAEVRLGKAEVGSSILPDGTRKLKGIPAPQRGQALQNPTERLTNTPISLGDRWEVCSRVVFPTPDPTPAIWA